MTTRNGLRFHSLALISGLFFAVTSTITVATSIDASARASALDFDDYHTITIQRFEEVLLLRSNSTLANDEAAIRDAIDQIVPAYNILVENSQDPHQRQATAVKISALEEVVFSHHSLRSRDLSKARNFVRIVFSVFGPCRLCPTASLGHKTSGRRSLEGSDGIRLVEPSTRRLAGASIHVPTLDQLKAQHNIFIDNSGNKAVEKVDKLRAKAISAAADAQVAARNVRIHESFIRTLDAQAREQRKDVELARAKVQQELDGAVNYVSPSGQSVMELSFVSKGLEETYKHLQDRLQETLAKLTEEIAQLNSIQKQAKALLDKASIAEQKVIDAEQKAAALAEHDAKQKNKRSASRASVITHIDLLDSDQLVYRDDLFLNTNNPRFSKGDRVADSNAVRLELGGRASQVFGMSGGWTRTFELHDASEVQIVLDYSMELKHGVDSDEYMLIMGDLDGIVFESTGGVIYQLRGNSKRSLRSGDLRFAMNFGSLPAGTHTIKFGAYLNQKTTPYEAAVATFNSATIIADHTNENQMENEIIKFLGTGSSAGFAYKDGMFSATRNQSLSKGSHVANEDGKKSLKIELGGRHVSVAHDMSGGWTRNFELRRKASDVRIEIDYRAELHGAVDYDYIEYVLVLAQVDDMVLDTNPNTGFVFKMIGKGELVKNVNSGTMRYSVSLGSLSRGTHKLRLGGYFNKKTNPGEMAVVLFDSVKITADYTWNKASSLLSTIPLGGSSDKFEYNDDIFLNTGIPENAKGYMRTDRNGDSTLWVDLGNHIISNAAAMSGGWSRSFELTQKTKNVLISFDYEVQIKHLQKDEHVLVVCEIDGVALEAQANTGFIDNIYGKGSDYSTTGVLSFSTDLGRLSRGTHNVSIGGFLNKKNWRSTRALVGISNINVCAKYIWDDVPVGPTKSTMRLLGAEPSKKFFFHAKSNTRQLSGTRTIDSKGDRSLRITLGNNRIETARGMFGEWISSFVLKRKASNVQLIFDFDAHLNGGFDRNQFILIKTEVNSTGAFQDSRGTTVYSLRGRGSRHMKVTSGPVNSRVDLGALPSGQYSIKFGVFLNKKTTKLEQAVVNFGSSRVVADYISASAARKYGFDGSNKSL